MRNRATLLAPVLTVLFLTALVGCSSDESASTTTEGDRSATEADDTTTAGDDGAAEDDDTTTTAGSSGGEASNAEWCTGMLEFFNTTSEGVFGAEQAETVKGLTEIAPAEVEAEMVIVRDGIVKVAEQGETDQAAAEATFTELGSPGSEYITAVETIYTWGQANCAPG